VVVTAGRTEEPVDPVRVLTNRSSGRMGVAIADEARDRGARVTLVAGVLAVDPPAGVEVVTAPTAQAMHEAVLERFAEADVLVMAAAVADFRPARPESAKIRRASGLAAIELEPTADIVRDAASRRRPGQVVVGFALETRDGPAAARRKLAEKGLDLVVLNNPTEAGSEFGGVTNRVTLFEAQGEPRELPLLTKAEVAGILLDRVAAILAGGARP
jgi:phosphopantothenoylcysteine decarboxylase/phosphopantothenate--cysteine ligase